ncbi:alpha/beta hydrolase [Tichowtungia aerotolerans]|uniref:Alpha/beta hydrolase fold domain-containing protein n=1 Tax=Tichowtungia aerotolerans TaxID=2697043 RepID=A0A6P1MA28_9BACT|nr:alpha/beta hydrolase fold domain-containing protein [Tichowtungia aerotolerans]QHI69404.1 alpha/beta hydrolase fold domain-containing protein [Tichowtungia aerotolerans]
MKTKLLLIVVVGMFNCLQAVETAVPDKEIVYKQVGDVVLKLHVFDPPGHSGTKKTSAVVFFFGGGWLGGSPSQFYRQSHDLASRGMVAICAEYRVKRVHGTSPRECVKDGKSAMRWVRSHAEELGIDPDRIVAGGGSAGGHIAAAVALLDGFNDKDDDLSVSPRPNALVLFNPVFNNGPDGGYGYDRVRDYWQEFSPMHNIDRDAPPTLVLQGTRDKYIPVSTVEQYKELMEQSGARCDLVLYEGDGHGFFNEFRYVETMTEVERFLASLGCLQ